jgi:hypothetical protein
MMMGFCRGEQLNLFEVIEVDLDIDERVSQKFYQFQMSTNQFEEISRDTLEANKFKKLGVDAVKTFMCKQHKVCMYV